MKMNFDKTDYKRGFWALFVTQFQGAFSDNLFRFFMAFFIVAAATKDSPEVQMTVSDVSAWAGILFALPFIIFPGLFGAVCDRFSKRNITVATKVIEIGVMALGVLAFLNGHPYALYAVLLLMATQSALFGPAKYGILPEILPEERLSWGNGFIQLGTTMAIIIGTVLAGVLFDVLSVRDAIWMMPVGLVGLAVVGLTFARKVSYPPPANPNQVIPINPYSGMGTYLKVIWSDRWLLMTVLGYIYFWFAGALIQANILPFSIDTLGLDSGQTSLLIGALALGIGLGALVAGFASRDKIEVGLVPVGVFGMGIFSALLSTNLFGYNGSMALLFGLGFFGGMFDVPLAATIQQRSPAHIRGGIMATVNMLTWMGIFAGSASLLALSRIGIDPYGVFMITAALSIGAGLYICTMMPVFLLRMGLWVLTNTLYRIRVFGRANIPEQGGALLVANHTSFLDALVILASMDRRVRFIMYQGVYDVPWVKPLAKMMGAIPVSAAGGPREVVRSLRNATEALKAGDLVCIFGEGQVTRTGQMLPFRKGFERVMKGVDAPIIPVHIDPIWGSVFDFNDGRFQWRWPRHVPLSITVGYGEQMPSDSNAFEMRNAIQELGSEAYASRKIKNVLLHRAFIKKVRRKPFLFAIADERSGAFSNIKLLIACIILARKLKERLGPAKMVGILLPQGVGGVLANVAMQLMGKVPVNLNYTASNESLELAAKQCEMKQIITAHAFLEQVPVDVPGEAIFVEDILNSVEKRDRLIALLYAVFCPILMLEKHLGAQPNRSGKDLATVIFSSGSEGEPKGIMLSHFNVASNIESAVQVFPHTKGDCLVGMLPFFHSFGFTATLWLVLTRDFCAAYHPNPLEARAIGKLIKKYKGKIMFTTSTFLHNFIRRCTPDQLASLDSIITGAEKLAPRVRDAFKEKFGIEPLEGYGTTECAPIVSLNIPDFRAPGFYQKGTRRGSIGHPLPGISVRILNPETRDVLQNGESGLLIVKGPNVMEGYLGNPEKTAEVLKDGWYETGDIATIDDEGFITITDRLARFSKIAGEMVSHTKIEECLQAVLDEPERVLAVAGVPDINKGERLVVLHTLSDEDFEMLLSKMDETGLPNLWIPKPKAFYKIDEIPVLGTGKMDIKAVKTLARRLDIGE